MLLTRGGKKVIFEGRISVLWIRNTDVADANEVGSRNDEAGSTSRRCCTSDDGLIESGSEGFEETDRRHQRIQSVEEMEGANLKRGARKVKDSRKEKLGIDFIGTW